MAKRVDHEPKTAIPSTRKLIDVLISAAEDAQKRLAFDASVARNGADFIHANRSLESYDYLTYSIRLLNLIRKNVDSFERWLNQFTVEQPKLF